MTVCATTRSLALGTVSTFMMAAAASLAHAQADSELVIMSSTNFTTMASGDAVSSTLGLVQFNVQESLVGRDRESGEFIPLLATDWEWDGDRVWRFELREGVTFHDGSPFNAESAAWAINHNFSPDRPAGRLFGFQVIPFEAFAVDDYTIEVRSEEPYANVIQLMWLSVLPSMQHHQEHGDEGWEREPVGTGPYRFIEWNRTEATVRLERNPDWWGHDDPEAANGAATIERVVLQHRGDDQSRIAAVAAGEADIAELVPGEACMYDLGDNCLQVGSIDHSYLRFDHPHPVLGDIRIRKAVTHAVPREMLGQTVSPGQPISQVLSVGGIGYNEDIPLWEHDPDRARELIAEAAADGVPVDSALILRGDPRIPGIEDIGVVIAAELSNVGLDISWEFLSNEVYRSQVLFKQAPDDPVPDDRGAIIIHRSSDRMKDFFVTGSQLYSCTDIISTYCNPGFTEKVLAAGQLTGDERHEALKELSHFIYVDEVAMLPLLLHSNFYGVSDRLVWDYSTDTHVYVKHMRFEE